MIIEAIMHHCQCQTRRHKTTRQLIVNVMSNERVYVMSELLVKAGQWSM